MTASLTRLCALVALASLVSCATTTDRASASERSQASGQTGFGGGAASLDQARRALTDVIGTAACSADAQCRTVAVGASPCGGPEAYLAWSVSSADATALAAASERYAKLRRADHERSGRLGVCVIVEDPGARCSPAGACVLREARPGAAGAPR